LDVNGEVVFGTEGGGPGFIDLNPYDAERLGVSRRHLMLRPTDTNLFCLDLGSTNGTRRNGRPIGAHTPYSLASGDILALGRLELVVGILQRPTARTAVLREKADLGEALMQMAKAITSQLELDEVLSQALEMAVSLASADETAIWLVDEQSGELFLEAECGIEDEQVRHMRLPVTDTMAGAVIESGEPLRASREPDREQIKVKTGYLVEAVVYVPLTQGGVTFGVLMAAHRAAGSKFDARDEMLLAAIADLAAIAVQNARLFRDLERSVSDLHEAQSQLVRAARLAALGELAAMVAHQINNPLTTVLADAEMLMQDLPLGRGSHDSAAAIFRAGQRAKTVVDRLLNMARADSHMQPLDVNDTIRAALELISGQLRATGSELEVDLASDLPNIDAFPGQLEDVWLNLLTNARDALRGTGSGAIGVTSALVGEGQAIEVTVWDNGSGIPPEHMEQLFSPFFTTKPRGAGTGLGLYICKQIISQHRGEIAVSSEPGNGTSISVRLPIVAPYRIRGN
jgi:signal transduction histidine kinase